MRWSDLQDQQPRLGALAHDRLVGPGVLLVATVRRDGTPRLSPVEPFVLDGDLWLSMLLDSLKAAALPWTPEVGRFHLFRVDVDDVTYVRYDNASGDQFVVRWPAGTETVRRGTSATTLGQPEPSSGVLV